MKKSNFAFCRLQNAVIDGDGIHEVLPLCQEAHAWKAIEGVTRKGLPSAEAIVDSLFATEPDISIYC